MPRLQPLPPETTPELKAHFDFFLSTLGFTPNSVLTMQRKPRLVKAFADLNAAVMDPSGEVELGFRRLIGHVASKAAGCLYCQAHTLLGALNFGVSDEKLAAVWNYETHPLYSEKERAALGFALAAASQPNAVTDPVFERVRRHWSEGEIVEILGVVAMFGFLNRWNDSMGTPLEAVPLEIARKAAPRGDWSPGKHGHVVQDRQHTSPSQPPLLGLMPGDMTGIGPEVTAKLLAAGTLDGIARIAVIGDARVFELGCRDAGVRPEWRRYDSVEQIDWSRREIPVVDLGNIDPATIQRGEISPESGRLTGETLKFMIDLAMAGRLDGISFAPLNKAALHRGGWKYHDEHQMFAALTGHKGFFGEMNVIREFATFRVTSHVGLRAALDLITPERIEEAVRLADRTLKATGVAQPRIGVAALNPHAGEGGLFGDEEIHLIRPVLEKLAAQGMLCTGPVPSDVVFIKAQKGEFDAVVTMYHDQGQIATKLLGFSKGVTVTAGLDTVFTTPAHGTAFDIVGQGKADPGALEQALRIAARMASVR